MTYAKQTWADNNPTYPVSAGRLAYMEQGIYDAHYLPGAKLYQSSNANWVSDASERAITYNTILWNQGMTVVISPYDRITVVTAGVYLANAGMIFSPSAGGTRSLVIYRLAAGTGQLLDQSVDRGRPGTAGQQTGVLSTLLCRCNVGDYLQAYMWQDSGSTLTAYGGYYYYLAAQLVGF